MPRAEEYGVLKHKAIIFGCDGWGWVIHEDPPYKNKRGVTMNRYLIIPGDYLMTTYPELQKQGALPVRTKYGMAIFREYPSYWVTDRNPSRTNAIVRVDCGFDGRETPHTERYKRLTEEIKLLNEELQNVQLSNLTLSEENRVLLGDRKAMMKDFVELTKMVSGDRNAGNSGFPEQQPQEPI